MNDENKSKTIALSEAASQKIDRWLEQIEGKRVHLSRKEFLHWFIEKSPDNLSNVDLNAIADRYFDEEKFLRRLLRDAKQARKDGQPALLEILVRHKKAEPKRDSAPESDTDVSRER